MNMNGGGGRRRKKEKKKENGFCCKCVQEKSQDFVRGQSKPLIKNNHCHGKMGNQKLVDDDNGELSSQQEILSNDSSRDDQEEDDEIATSSVYCPFPNCSSRVDDLKIHFKKNAKDHKMNESDQLNDLKSIELPFDPNKVFFKKSPFFKVLPFNYDKIEFYEVIYRRNNRFYFWVYCNDTKDIADKYYITIRIKSSDKEREISYTGNLISMMDYGLDEIIKKDLGLSLSDSKIQDFFNTKDNFLNTEIKIVNRTYYIICPDLDCQEQINSEELNHHIKSNHSKNIRKKKGKTGYFPCVARNLFYDDGPKVWNPYIIIFDGITFYECLYRKDGRFHHWIYCHGNEDVANKYTCKLIVFSPDKKVEASKSMPTVSMKLTKDEVISNKLDLNISDSKALKLWDDENNSLHTECIIQKSSKILP